VNVLQNHSSLGFPPPLDFGHNSGWTESPTLRSWGRGAGSPTTECTNSPRARGQSGLRGQCVRPPGRPTEARGMASGQKKHEAQGMPHSRPGSWVIPSWAGPGQPVSRPSRGPGAPRARHGDVGEVRALRKQQSLPRRGPTAPKGPHPECRLGSDPLAHCCCRGPQSAGVSHASPSGPGSRELSLGGRERSELRAH